jgi:hypothetical protein
MTTRDHLFPLLFSAAKFQKCSQWNIANVKEIYEPDKLGELTIRCSDNLFKEIILFTQQRFLSPPQISLIDLFMRFFTLLAFDDNRG